MSRAYKRGVVSLEPVIQPIVERIVAGVQPDGQIEKSVLDTVFALSTLLKFGVDVPPLTHAVSSLITKQGVAGEWPRWLFYYGGPKLLKGWGLEELTTGFGLEALASYLKKKQSLAWTLTFMLG